MTSFARMILSLFGLAILLFLGAYLFSPHWKESTSSGQYGQSPVGQLKANEELKSAGQPVNQAPDHAPNQAGGAATKVPSTTNSSR